MIFQIGDIVRIKKSAYQETFYAGRTAVILDVVDTDRYQISVIGRDGQSEIDARWLEPADAEDGNVFVAGEPCPYCVASANARRLRAAHWRDHL